MTEAYRWYLASYIGGSTKMTVLGVPIASLVLMLAATRVI